MRGLLFFKAVVSKGLSGGGGGGGSKGPDIWQRCKGTTRWISQGRVFQAELYQQEQRPCGRAKLEADLPFTTCLMILTFNILLNSRR